MFCANYILNTELATDMCARLLACPLCSQPGFLTLDALRAGLISVATRPLICPVCNEVLLGIDKLTIHLFSHTINLNSNTVESSKPINIATSNTNSIAVHHLQDATFQEWNTSKVQIADTSKHPESNNITSQNSPECSKSIETSKDKVSIIHPETGMQQQNPSLQNMSQIPFSSAESCESEKGLYKTLNNKSTVLQSLKNSQQMLPETIKLNYATQYYTNDDTRHITLVQNYNQAEHENIQRFKYWIQDQRISTKNVTSAELNKPGRGTAETVNSRNHEQNTMDHSALTLTNKGNKFLNFESFSNMTMSCSNDSANSFNNEKNRKNNHPATDNDNRNENLEQEQISPYLKVFKAITVKEKSERCNICGFHFPDYNILLLHKQLVHTIDEKELNGIPENFLKNYSCHLCSKVFKMRGSLMVHMRVAHTGYNLGSPPKDGQVELIFNENGYNCPTCGKRFKKEQHVIQHLKTHEAKQWECDVCSKMFTTKYFLKKHKRLHSGEMPYKCSICNKTFTFQQSYHKHRLYHKDDKPHTCTTCGRSFKELSTLHNHERIHTGEKPFACETCGKCFRQRVSYLVHRRIHTGVMPYKCTMCGKSFRYKVSQRTHKCSAQLGGSTQQASNIEQNLIELRDNQTINSETCNTQKNPLLETHPTLHVINNEENKYVLIINTQGQHLLTKESDVETIQATPNKEQKVKEYIGMNDRNKELTSIWNSDIPNNPDNGKSTETYDKVQSENEKTSREDASDFFSMVMSPLENGLSSPTTEMQHLRVSSPTQDDVNEVYNNYKSNIAIESFNSDNNGTNTLQTINEESLKQLLYGINEK